MATKTKASSPIGRTIPARFDGFCRTCRQQFTAGELITKVAYKTWIHAACAATGSAPPAPSTSEPPAAEQLDQDDKSANVTAEELLEYIRQEATKVLEDAELEVNENDVRAIVHD